MVEVKTKKEYEGFARRVLLPDTVGNEIKKYDILDDTGNAYVLAKGGQEVKTSHFEGRWATAEFFRIASFPTVAVEDVKIFGEKLEDHAKAQGIEAIRKQEDARLITLLNAAIEDWDHHEEHYVTPSHTLELPLHSPIHSVDLDDLIARIKVHEIDPKYILTNPRDAVQISKLPAAADLEIIESVMMPEGSSLILPDPSFLGVMPILYDVDTVENKQVEQFKKGWVIDEVLGMMVLNPRGLARIIRVRDERQLTS